VYSWLVCIGGVGARTDCPDMNHPTAETFHENARVALADEQLRGALRNATSLFGERRLSAARSLNNWEGCALQAREIKDKVLLNLDTYLEQFVCQAEARGARVHWARDAHEANEVICRLAMNGEPAWSSRARA